MRLPDIRADAFTFFPGEILGTTFNFQCLKHLNRPNFKALQILPNKTETFITKPHKRNENRILNQ